MKRLVLCSLVVGVLGCGGRKLPEVEKELATVGQEEAGLQREVAAASQDLAESQRAQDAEQARLTRATRSLSANQAEAVRRWGGNPKKLAELKKANPMPAPLLLALDAAQNSAKDSTPERLFEQSVGAGKLSDAAALLDGWEAAEFSYEAEEQKDACTPDVPKLSKCRGNAKQGTLLCDGPDNTWLIWAEHGVLYTKSAPQTGLEIAERPAPGIWVLSHGTDKSVYESRENDMLLRWVATLPAKSKLEWKNLDNDPFPEGIFQAEGAVRLFDIESAHGMSALSELDSCKRLEALGALPDSAKAGCKQREVAAATPADAGH